MSLSWICGMNKQDPHPYFEALREAVAVKKQLQSRTPASRNADEAELKLVGMPSCLCFGDMFS